VEEGAPSQKTCRAPQIIEPLAEGGFVFRRSLTVAVMALVAAGAASSHRAAAFPVTIHAANGDVTITKQPTRVVSLSPTATEDLFALGAAKQVVAVDEDSDYPKQAPRTKLSGFTPNAEAVAGYNPDLVIVSNDGGIVAQLQKLGIAVLLEPAADTIAQAYDEIRQLGAATGHAAGATKVVRGMQRKLTTLIRSVPKTRRHLRVFHELSPDYYSATSATFIGRVYKLFGFSNIADAADSTHTGYPQLSAEYVVSADPQIVVLADSVCCGTTAATVASRPGWSQLAAVKEHRVVAVDDSIASRWGPRLVDFVAAVARVARASG
jgi:iron complex transport system substrate-binding protein